MLDFRKALFAMAVAGLGLVGTASAQVTCGYSGLGSFSTNPNAAAETVSTAAGPVLGVRQEGVTEQLPPLVIAGSNAPAACTGTTDTPTVTVTIQSSAPLTNTPLTGAFTGTTDAIATLNYTPPGGAATNTTVVGVLTSSSTMVFTFGTSTAPITAASTVNYILASNLRINATGSPAGTTFTLTAFGTNGIVVTSTSAVPAALSQASLGTATFTGYANLAICQIGSKDIDAVGVVSIKDNFIGAFTNPTQELNKEAAANAVAGVMAANPNTSTTVVGSVIALNFANLASAGVTYYLPLSVTNGSLSLELVTAPTCPVTTASCIPTPVASAIGGTGSTTYQNTGQGNSVSGIVAFTPSSTGTFTAYYAILADGNATVTFDATGSAPTTPVSGTMALPTVVTLYETVPSASAVTPPTAAPTVTETLAGTTSPYYAEFSAPTGTAVTALLNKAPAGQLTLCNTTILAPYLLTGYGYDTGLAFANAGTGTSVLGNTVTATTAGTCALTLYGSSTLNGFTATPSTAITPFTVTVSIPAGQVNAMNLSALLPSATTTTFVGYGVANCNFQGGHLFAQISNPTTGISEGYLGVVLAEVNGGAFNAVVDSQ